MRITDKKRHFYLVIAISLLCVTFFTGCAPKTEGNQIHEGGNIAAIEIPQQENNSTEVGTAPAARSIKVMSVEGIAYIEQEDEKAQLQAEMELSEGDTIVTEENGYVVLLIDEQKTVHIDNSSKLLLSVVSHTDGHRTTNLLLKDGGMLSHIDERLPEQEIYEVYTDNIVMGIRGTVVSVYYDDDNANNLVRFLHGSGLVKNTDHTNEQPISVWQQAYADNEGNIVIENWGFDQVTEMEIRFLSLNPPIEEALRQSDENQEAQDVETHDGGSGNPPASSTETQPVQTPMPTPPQTPAQAPDPSRAPVAPPPAPPANSDDDYDDSGDSNYGDAEDDIDDDDV